MRRSRLEEGLLSVEAVQPHHIEPIRQWRNAQMGILRQSAVVSPEEQEAYYRTHIWPDKRSLQPQNVLLAYLENDELIGYGGLVHVAWIHRRAEVSFLLKTELAAAQKDYSRYFSSFLRLMKILAFDDLGLERLFTETYVERKRHIATLEATGFRLEGVFRRHVWIGGRPVDSVFHGCLRTYER